MSTVIRAAGLSKQYAIGTAVAYHTLRDTIAGWMGPRRQSDTSDL